VVDWNEDIAETLAQCCARRAVALILAHDVQSVCEARFAELKCDAVLFDLSPAQSLPAFRAPGICTVTFHHDSRMRLFVARVSDFRPSPRTGPAARLTLALPRQVVEQDARLTSRIPVVDEAGLEVRVHVPGAGTISAHPFDISASGILIAVGGTPLVTDTEVDIELSLGELRVRLPGVVRRHHDDNAVGILFPTTVNGGTVRAPTVLREIVERLERMWLGRPSRVSAVPR
jgi:hypothetical protein